MPQRGGGRDCRCSVALDPGIGGWAVVTGSAVAESQRRRTRGSPAGRRCALIAGADPSIRQLVRTVLEIGGFQVIEAASHEDVRARLAAAERIPQVVILDVSLPNFAGLPTL